VGNRKAMGQSVMGRNAQDAARGVDLPERYEITGLIGVGGMAAIWAAEDRLLRRSVAIKVLAEQFAEQARFVERFQREARTAASLSGHPHVVTIYDVGEHAGRPFIVMEHLSGGTFADRMSAGRPGRADVLRWLGEAADALDFAHAKGVVHRDVKPRNLLFDGMGRLVVADFGIARVAFEEQLTVSGELLGTAAYISPEQTLGEPATPASDRYAFAVVAYEALTGGLPFGKGTLMEIATRRTQMDPPPASERSPDLPAAVDDVLLRGLARDPAARWDSAGQFVSALEAAVGAASAKEETAPASPAPPRARQPDPPAISSEALGLPSVTMERVRRRPPVAAILLGVAAAAVGLIVGLTFLNDDGGGGGTTRTDRGKSTQARRADRERSRSAGKQPQAAPSQSPAAPGGSGAALNDQGFQLMRSGRYEEAIPVLERAVAAFPEGSTDLTLAYALYNLGRSLRLAGRPDDAIPILERRLRVNNQRGAVAKELAAARRAAG
jgi:eukaryotic-like serine/threonine-protein kinase